MTAAKEWEGYKCTLKKHRFIKQIGLETPKATIIP